LEPKTGVFVGNPSARVRDELWQRAIKNSKKSGAVLQIWPDQNLQGFSYRQFGDRERMLVVLEGISLVSICRWDAGEGAKNADTGS
jgi:CRISPR-associated protein Cas2